MVNENDVAELNHDSSSNADGRSTNEDSILSHFQEVTGKTNVDECLQLLDESNWNLEQAVQKAFNPPIPTPDPPTEQVPPLPDTTNLRQRLITQGNHVQLGESNFIGPRYSTLSGPIINRNPPSLLQTVFSYSWSIVYFPMKLIFTIISSVVSFALDFLFGGGPPTPRQAISNVEDHIAEFNLRYGSMHPRLYHGSYKEAISHAKRHLRFLLVHLHRNGDATAHRFAQDVVCTYVFKNLVEDNLLFWSCTTEKAEGRCVAESLSNAKAPFLALLCYKDSQMRMVYKNQGLKSVEEVIAELTAAIVENEPHLARQRTRQNRLSESTSSQMLMQEQDAAYQESLLRDQERVRKKREEEEAMRQIQEKEDAERQAKENKIRAIETLREKLKQTLKPESKADTLSLLFKLPDGSRVARKFAPDSTVKDLYEFALTCDECPNFFSLVSNFPKRELPSDGDCYLKTCLEMEIQNATTLFVEEIESEAELSEVEV